MTDEPDRDTLVEGLKALTPADETPTLPPHLRKTQPEQPSLLAFLNEIDQAKAGEDRQTQPEGLSRVDLDD